jgi:uncharacterized protein YacL
MIIEIIRLVVTLAATAAGFLIGRSAPEWYETGGPSPDAAIILGAVLGAGVGYVLGGLLGRFFRRSLDQAPELVKRASGPELFAGAFGLIAGLLVGAVISVPAIILLPAVIGWASAALLVIVLASFGSSVFSARADDLLATAGLGQRRGRLAGPDESPMAGSFVIDSSAAIDGRILDLARVGLVVGQVWVPAFVLDELQGIADSGQKERRRRGRRGLDILDAISGLAAVDLRSDERTFPEFPEVDAKLIAFCVEAGSTLVTTDHNLAAAAGLRGVSVLNPHALGESMRRVPMAGETLQLLIEKEGSEPGQGVGYLDDGTMVVVEEAGVHIGEKIDVEVFSAMRTSIGRMVFAKMGS